MELPRFSKATQERLIDVGAVAFRSVQVLFVSYIMAGMITSSMVMYLIDKAAVNPTGKQSIRSDGESFTQSPNLREIQKVIKDRNVFNSEGAFPDEPDPSEIQAQQALVFNENAPCSKTTLNIELRGTIYLGESGDSLATIQEKSYSQADIYKAGDVVIGSENAKIHRVEQKKVIINNNGKKECLELDADQGLLASNGAGSSDVGVTPTYGGEETPDEGGPTCTSAVLEAKYVKEEIGAGFDRALNKGRVVPHSKDGQHVGFKIIGVERSGIFAKACLRSGDVITQVNDTVLQPDQGFTFYQAFQEEQRIRVNLLRNGTTPMTINIEIKN